MEENGVKQIIMSGLTRLYLMGSKIQVLVMVMEEEKDIGNITKSQMMWQNSQITHPVFMPPKLSPQVAVVSFV